MSLQSKFPNLHQGQYVVTSPRTPFYNCLAWAAGESTRWWEPGAYWPSLDVSGSILDAVVRVFSARGFAQCQSEAAEPGFEKIAIYVANGEFTHIARQLSDGSWTSKLGNLEDISHQSLQALTGSDYGVVHSVWRRQSAPSAAASSS